MPHGLQIRQLLHKHAKYILQRLFVWFIGATNGYGYIASHIAACISDYMLNYVTIKIVFYV